MVPRGRTSTGRSLSPERRVLSAATYHLTDSVPQTAAFARNRKFHPPAPPPSQLNDVERRRAARWLLRHPHEDHVIAHKVWPPTSPFQDASGLTLPAPMQLVLPANSSAPPFMANSELVTAPNTAHGRSGPAQLGHRLATFERVSPSKYVPDTRYVLAGTWDPLKYVPRPARDLKPEPEQSGVDSWNYTVPEQLAAPSVRSTRQYSVRARPVGEYSVVMAGHRPRTTEDIFGLPGRRGVDEEHSVLARVARSMTPDGSMTPKQFRLETPDVRASPWTATGTRAVSPSREEEGGCVPQPVLAALLELQPPGYRRLGLRPGSRSVLGIQESSMLSNPFSTGRREERQPGLPAGWERRESAQFPGRFFLTDGTETRWEEEQRPKTPAETTEWEGAYRRNARKGARDVRPEWEREAEKRKKKSLIAERKELAEHGKVLAQND